jgi:hypothetical protein
MPYRIYSPLNVFFSDPDVPEYGYNITELENNGLSIILRRTDDDNPDALIASAPLSNYSYMQYSFEELG